MYNIPITYKVCCITCPTLGKLYSPSKCCADFSMQTTFKAKKHLSKKDQVAISSTFHFESILYGNIKAQSRCKHRYNFKSILNGEAKNSADAGLFKVKYSVNAENFKRILKRHPLIRIRIRGTGS